MQILIFLFYLKICSYIQDMQTYTFCSSFPRICTIKKLKSLNNSKSISISLIVLFSSLFFFHTFLQEINLKI